ncbi:MAG: VanZ family protein [Defluviitaleaceae bacterium]|nr:VanZ family protein [Defluviitaleaceae bacterium]
MSRVMKILWPVLSVLSAAGIFLSSSITGEYSGLASLQIAIYVQNIIPLADETLNFLVRKAAHFAVYFVLAFCIAQSLKFYIVSRKKLLISAWAIASIYGITDEMHQYFVPGRVMSALDMIINAAGALAGAALVAMLIRNKANLKAPTG